MNNREIDAYTAHRLRIQEIRKLEKRRNSIQRRTSEIIHEVTEDHRFLLADTSEEGKRRDKLVEELQRLRREGKEVDKEIERKIEIDIDLSPLDIIRREY